MNRIKYCSFVSTGALAAVMFNISCSRASLKGTTDSSPSKPAPATGATSTNQATTTSTTGGGTSQNNPSTLPSAGNQSGLLPGGSSGQSGTLVSGAQGIQIDPSLSGDQDAIRKCLNLWVSHPFKSVGAKNYKHVNVSVGADVGTIANDILGKNLGGLKVPSYSVGGVDDQEVTPDDKLIVVEFSANWGNVNWKMMNPKGWYCVKGAFAGSDKVSKVTIYEHCTAHVAASDLNLNLDTHQNQLAINSQKDGGQLGVSINSQFDPQRVSDLTGTRCR